MKESTDLLKNIRIITNGKGISGPVDMEITNGVITAIAEQVTAKPNCRIENMEGAFISIGWMDVGVHACDPGLEHREDLVSASGAAMHGGYGAIAIMPNTQPTVHSKSEISYIQNKAANQPVSVFPLGAVSVDCAGKDLAELYDMKHAGAVAFTDGDHPIRDAGLLLRALQYASGFGGLIFNQPYNASLIPGGQMHEGIVSTSLGLRGIPSLAEEIMVQRDLSLLAYAGKKARLHLHLVSTASSVLLIREAKRAGLSVTASVALANLCYHDTDLAMENMPFDTSLKTHPPLRSRKDSDVLLAGLLDGTIDFISTNHSPWHEEAKNLEFTYAEFGTTGLQTAFPMYQTFLKNKISLEKWVELVSVNPRKVLGVPVPEIAVGQRAAFTVIQPDEKWVLSEKTNQSKSICNPLWGKECTGKAFFRG